MRPVTCLLLVTCLCVQASAPAAAARAAIPAAGRAALSAHLSQSVARGDVPGIVTLVVDREGVLFQHATGKLDVARGVDMPADAIFRIASMTKPITSVAIMMLVDAGRVRLDDPVATHLPDFEGRQVIATFQDSDATYRTRPAKRPMTIRHLLAHTSGIGYPFSSPVVARLVERTATRETELPLLHDPGERWTYGASTHVLGRIVERISGQPLDAFLRARVFDPLRMSETSYAVPSHKVPRVATVHRRVGGRLVEQPNASQQAAPVRGDGGLYSTADDYGRFLRMLLGGGALHSTRLLSERSVRLMGENQIGTLKVEEQPAADPTLTRPFPMGAGRDRFGLGFQIAAQERRDAPLRSAGSLSWAGINNTHFWVDATRGIAAVVLMQVLPFYDEACMRTLRGFEELLYQHLG